MEPQTVTGRSLLASDFRVSVTKGHFDASDLLAALEGRLAAAMAKDAMSEELCRRLVDRFWSSPGRLPRPDGVSGHYLGAYHYGKSFNEYIADIGTSEPYIQALLEGDSPIDSVLAQIRSAVTSQNLALRRAIWRGRLAAPARALTWTTGDKYLLSPHDDVGQLCHPDQRDFEIQQVADHTVLAVNIYPRVSRLGGAVRVWNCLPDQICRERFGVPHTGYPYPESALRDVPYFDLEVETGSVAIVNGGLVHAVLGYGVHGEQPERDRLLINMSVGRIDSKTVVHWV